MPAFLGGRQQFALRGPQRTGAVHKCGRKNPTRRLSIVRKSIGLFTLPTI